MNFNFGEVLSSAWHIAWKHKVLWWAGIVVSVFGLLSMPISLFTNPTFSSSFPGSSYDLGRNLAPILIGNALIILMSILSIPVTAMAILIPSVATVQVERGSEKIHFLDSIKASFPYFWRTLGLFLLVYVVGFLVTFLLMGCLILFSVITLGFGALCFIPFFIALIPLLILVYALMEQSIAAIVVDNLGVWSALQRGWELVRKNILAMAVLSILVYLAYMVIGMLISIPMMIPFFGMFLNLNAQQPPDISSFNQIFRNMMWWMLAFSPLYAVLQGFLLAFMQSAWTLTYMRLSRPVENPPAVIEANA